MDIIQETRGGALRLTLNRPEAGNKLTTAMLTAIADAIRGVKNDNGVCAVLIDANGPDFCIGGELGVYWKLDPWDIRLFADAFIEALLQMHSCTRPVILSAAGRVWGGGMCLLDAADVAIAREDATFAIPEVLDARPPVLSFVGTSRNLSDKLLMRMALCGESMNAREALHRGLISAVAKDETEQAALCEKWIETSANAGVNPARVIKELRVAVDCQQYERQLRAAGALLVQALLGGGDKR